VHDLRPRLLGIEELADRREADRGDRPARIVAQRRADAADTVHRFLLVDRVPAPPRHREVGGQRVEAGDREERRAREPDSLDQGCDRVVVERGQQRLADGRAVEWPARARARIRPDVAVVADDLVDVEQLSPIRYHEEGRIVRCADETLEPRPRGRPQFEAVADVQAELDQPHAEPKGLPACILVVEVTPLQQRVDQPVRAAPGDSELVADARERQALRLGSQ
jgi:hypothetical protein